MADMRAAEEAVRARALQIASDASQELAARQQQETVVVTGRLQAGVYATPPAVVGQSVGFELVDDAPHAGPYAFGAKPHVIKARNARALRFTVGSRTVFRVSVNHPGNPAHPSWWSEDSLGRRFEEALQRVADR